MSDKSFFLGKQCLLDEEPLTDDLFCKDSGKRGQVFVPARIMNGKKGDVVLLPGGPIGFIGKLLLALTPPQFFSHCGIMTGNFYKLRHATASDEWVEDQVTGTTFVAPDDRGTQGFDPEGLKYIWPGAIDQSVEQAFHGSYFLYSLKDGKHKKPYKIEAFSNDPAFFMEHDRHVVFPLVLKPDPLLEGDAAFAHVRPTLHKVAEKAKQIKAHYRFFCYSNSAISLKDDTAHLAPDQGPSWWASGTRPMVCSSMVLAAVDDVTDVRIRLEGRKHVYHRRRSGKDAASQPAGRKGAGRGCAGRPSYARRYVLLHRGGAPAGGGSPVCQGVRQGLGEIRGRRPFPHRCAGRCRQSDRQHVRLRLQRTRVRRRGCQGFGKVAQPGRRPCRQPR